MDNVVWMGAMDIGERRDGARERERYRGRTERERERKGDTLTHIQNMVVVVI